MGLDREHRPNMCPTEPILFPSNIYQSWVPRSNHLSTIDMDDNNEQNKIGQRTLTDLFPNISRRFIKTLGKLNVEAAANGILDRMDSGETLPERRRPKQTFGKRKRGTGEQGDDIEENVSKSRRRYASINQKHSQRSPEVLNLV